MIIYNFSGDPSYLRGEHKADFNKMIGRKKILLVSNAFYPEISPRSFRCTELVKEFYRQGHDVTVISKIRAHDYSEFLKEFPVSLKMWSKPLFPKVPESRHKYLSYLSKLVARVLSLLFEYPAIEEMFQVKRILNHESGYDFMISFAVPFPIHWGVAITHSKKNPIARTWVADCGDPYMFARLDSFRKPFYFKIPETYFCRKCDFISIPFYEMQVQFYPQFISKIRVIPQGFNFEEIRLYEGHTNNQKPVFKFAGSIIPGRRDLKLFFEFLNTLQFDFLFVVYTNQREWFAKYIKALGHKLEVNGYIERLPLLFELSKADFLVNVDTVLDNHSNIEAVPSKLIDYALTNRPILNIISDYLDKELVMKFMNKDYSGKRLVDKSNFDIRKVSAQFLALID